MAREGSYIFFIICIIRKRQLPFARTTSEATRTARIAGWPVRKGRGFVGLRQRSLCLLTFPPRPVCLRNPFFSQLQLLLEERYLVSSCGSFNIALTSLPIPFQNLLFGFSSIKLPLAVSFPPSGLCFLSISKKPCG
jgi:hypothetical protein